MDNLWLKVENIVEKWRNCLFWAISSFVTMFSSLNPFPHTIILQQTTLNVFCQNIEKLHNWMDNLWLKVENIVAKGEIACFELFLLLSLIMFSNSRLLQRRLYEGKGSAILKEKIIIYIFLIALIVKCFVIPTLRVTFFYESAAEFCWKHCEKKNKLLIQVLIC